MNRDVSPGLVLGALCRDRHWRRVTLEGNVDLPRQQVGAPGGPEKDSSCALRTWRGGRLWDGGATKPTLVWKEPCWGKEERVGDGAQLVGCSSGKNHKDLYFLAHAK